MRLLVSQKNAVFDMIQGVGLSPAQFKCTEVESHYLQDGLATKFTCNQTEYYFLIDKDANEHIHLTFCPAEETIEGRSYCYSWDETAKRLGQWIEYVFREVREPDKWARLSTEVESLNMALEPQPSQDRFTVQEYESLVQSLSVLGTRIKQIEGLSEKQLSGIDTELEHLKEMAKSLSKVDWKSMFVGTIITLIIQLSIGQEQGRAIWAIVKEVFNKFILP